MPTTELLTDLVTAAAVFGATVLLGRACYRVAGSLLGSDNSLQVPESTPVGGGDSNQRPAEFAPPEAPIRIAAALLLSWAAIVLTSLVLNLSGALHPVTLQLAIAVGSVAVGWIYRSHRQTRVNVAGTIDMVLLGAASLLVTQMILFGLVILPNDWDTLAYHLPLVDHWIRSGNLADNSTAFWYVPGNLELLGYYFSGAFSGDFWAQLANTPVIALLATSTLALCDQLGIRRRTARWVCFAAVINPIVLRQVSTVENDVAVATLFVVATLFGMKAVSSGRLAPLLLCGIATGLLAGVKYYAIAYVGVVAFTVTLLIAIQYGVRRGSRSSLVFIAGFAVFASFWYVRNLAMSGTPIFPKGIPVLGLSGPWDKQRPEFATTCLALGLERADLPPLAVAWGLYGGPLLTLSLLIAPIIVTFRVFFLLPRFMGNSSTRYSSGDHSGCLNILPQFAVLLCAIGGMLVYSITPNVLETYPESRNMLKLQYHPVRFGFSAVLLMFISLVHIASMFFQWAAERGVGMESVSPPTLVRKLLFAVVKSSLFLRQWGLPFLALASAAVALLPQYGWRRQFLENGLRVWRPNGLDYSAVILAGATVDVGVILWIFYSGLNSRRRISRVIAWSLLSTVTVIATFFLGDHWHSNYNDHFEAIGPISLADPIGQEISGHRAVICEYRYYATLGSRRENDVCRPLFAEDDGTFREYLKTRAADVVVTLRRDFQWSQSYSVCYPFLSHPESGFVEVEEIEEYSVFRRRSDEAEPAEESPP